MKVLEVPGIRQWCTSWCRWVGRIKLNITDEEVEEWVNGDKVKAVTFTLSNEDLIDAVLEERYEKITESDSEKDDPEPKVLWRDAVKGLAVFVKFAEQCT